MIQIVFTDNGKVHTVTFSGEDAVKWAYSFRTILYDKSIPFELKHI